MNYQKELSPLQNENTPLQDFQGHGLSLLPARDSMLPEIYQAVALIRKCHIPFMYPQLQKTQCANTIYDTQPTQFVCKFCIHPWTVLYLNLVYKLPQLNFFTFNSLKCKATLSARVTSHAGSKIRGNALQMLLQMQQEMSEIKCTVFPSKVESCQLCSKLSVFIQQTKRCQIFLEFV